MKKGVGKNNKEFITVKEAFGKAFYTGALLGFDLGGFGERVAPMLARKIDPKEIEEILKRELAAIFQRFEGR